MAQTAFFQSYIKILYNKISSPDGLLLILIISTSSRTDPLFYITDQFFNPVEIKQRKLPRLQRTHSSPKIITVCYKVVIAQYEQKVMKDKGSRAKQAIITKYFRPNDIGTAYCTVNICA